MNEAKYTDKEILKLAISMEEEGVRFYEQYAEQADGETKKEFLRLAHDEQVHAKTFQKLYDQIEGEEEGAYLFTEEVDVFFRSYAKSKGFEREEKKANNIQEAVEIGIETEKITIDYYESILKYAKSETESVLNRLIKEEKGHLAFLQGYLTRLSQ